MGLKKGGEVFSKCDWRPATSSVERRPPSFHELSVGEASRPRAGAGSLGTEEKTSPPFPNIHFRSVLSMASSSSALRLVDNQVESLTAEGLIAERLVDKSQGRGL